MKILVTGGAGYIGGFMTKRLLDDGHEVVVADTLERAHKEISPRATLREGNLQDPDFVSSLFQNTSYDVVMHFAAYISVGESMQDPGMYLKNNVLATVMLLDEMQKNGVKHFIFSSTGTVYGTPDKNPIPESHTLFPENPYAESKLMVEKILHWYYEIYGIGYSVLRYFNASGAALDGSYGEEHHPETHLIPNVIAAAKSGTEFSLFGDDYNTPDGTCIRDYIHVLDLVEAHILTLKKLQEQNGEYTYNVGTGKGHSNKEIVDMVKSVSGKDFPLLIKPRRPGDVAETVADITKIQKELQFTPKYSDLRTIVESAWKWHTAHDSK